MSAAARHSATQTSREEVAAAMAAGRSFAADLRAALKRQEDLGAAPDLRAARALYEQIASLRQDLTSIAGRAYVDVDVLICLLDVEDDLRRTYRRKPSVPQLVQAIARRVENDEREERVAHAALTAAQDRVARATRSRVASGAARGVLKAIAA